MVDDIDAISDPPDGSPTEPRHNPAAEHSRPLSWTEARQKLKDCLEQYVEESTKQQYRRMRRSLHNNESENENEDEDNPSSPSSSLVKSVWFRWDLDIWFGSVGSSVAILVVGALATVESITQNDDPRSMLSSSSFFHRFARSQLTGSILILIGCLMNIWSINRYRFSASQGTDGLKRRMIARFIRTIADEEEHCSRKNAKTDNISHDRSDKDNNGIDLTGTSLTDIYPVYRRSTVSTVTTSQTGAASNGNNEVPSGSWSRVPALLLVRGDLIALQVGDVAPCKCRVLNTEGGEQKISAEFDVGETITVRKSSESEENIKQIISDLPKGRTTFPPDSNKLLQLCNGMTVFKVLETPIVPLLREKEKDPKSPQLLRQLETIRSFLSACGAILFLLSIIVLLGRSWNSLSLSSSSNQSQLYFLLPTPFLVLLSAVAFTGPMYLIFIESLGTSRILASYHPVSSRGQTKRSGEVEEPNVDILILRYFLSTLSNRYALQDIGRRLDRWLLNGNCFGSTRRAGGTSLVRVPPASLFLLEKLGVATALTVVDDELVCEPQAVPQQLLIPSGKGLKLLDLCPTYEDDTDDDDDDDRSSSMEFRRARQRSFDADLNYDSDSDSDDGQMKDHHHVPRRKKPRRRRLVRKAFRVSSQKKEEGVDGESDDDDDDVQFEDPTWWQQLPSLKCIGLGSLLVDPKNQIQNVQSRKIKQDNLTEVQFNERSEISHCKKALVGLISRERRSQQLRALARCIGFSTKPNYTGSRGDISPFIEKLRLHVVSASMVRNRLDIDAHERSSEDARWWGLLRADSTSVIVQDNRSGAYQLLTVGDPKVVTRMCHEAWQGENSTILPLAAQNRATILETSDNWKLADLDVEAFCYAPIPHTFEARLSGNAGSKVSAIVLCRTDRIIHFISHT